MPKIPVYEQQVDLAAGSLGPRASAAFEEPGRALAGLGQQVRETAFKFGMMEKEAEVKAKSAEFESDTIQTTSQFNETNKETTTAAAKQKYKDEVETPMLQKLDAMDLTPNQRRDVKARLSRQLLKGSIDVQQVAANNGRIMRGGMVDKRLLSLQTQYATTSDPVMKAAASKQANDLIADSLMNGDKITYSPKSWRNGAVSEDIATRVNSASSYQDFESAKKEVRGNPGYTEVEKAQQEAIIITKQSAFVTAEKKRINGEVFAAMLSEDEFNEAMTQASTGDILIKRDDEQVGISLAGMPNDERLNIVTSLRTQRNVKVSEDERQTIESHSTTFGVKSLSDLQKDVDDLRNGTGFADGMSLRVRNSLETIVSNEISDRAPRVTATIANNTDAIKSQLKLSNGVPDEDTNAILQDTIELHNSLGDQAGAERLAAEVQGFAVAGSLYSSVKYQSDAAILKAGATLKQAVRDAKTADETNVAMTQLEAFNAMVTNRQETLKNDPVDFLQSENRTDKDDEQATLTAQQLIEKQAAMNIPDGDIRILSNAQVTSFQTQYKGLKTYADKSDYAVNFLADYNPSDQNRIMRNLIKSDAITLVDSMIIANPSNAAMFAVDAGNEPENAKAISALFTPTERRDIAELVSAENTDYTGSVTGGQIEGGMVSRGATASRTLHATTINSIITNTALYYKSVDGNISDSAAVEKAIDTVVNSQFSFGNVNGKPLRFPASMGSDASDISKKLESSLSNTEYLGSIVDVPADSPFNQSRTPQQAEQAYASELASSGYWVTTSDNQGAYLVDQNGNKVPRKAPVDDFAGRKLTLSDMFVMVKFSDVKSNVDEANLLDKERPAIGVARIEATKVIEAQAQRPIF